MADVGDRLNLELPEVQAVQLKGLVAFEKRHLQPGQASVLNLTLGPDRLATVVDNGDVAVLPGRYQLPVGGSHGDAQSLDLMQRPVARAAFQINGQPTCLIEACRPPEAITPSSSP